jgi:hypothetical protein
MHTNVFYPWLRIHIGDPGGNIWKTLSLIHIGDNYDDNLNRGSIRVQGPPICTSSRNEGITMSKDKTFSSSITFLGFSHAYERVLSMASYTHCELELPFKLRVNVNLPGDITVTTLYKG